MGLKKCGFHQKPSKVGEAAKALHDAEQRLKSLLSPEDSAQFKKTYHTLVKRLHPDLNPTQPVEHASLWDQASERSDIATLQSLELLTESARPADTAAASALDTLRAEVRVFLRDL